MTMRAKLQTTLLLLCFVVGCHCALNPAKLIASYFTATSFGGTLEDLLKDQTDKGHDLEEPGNKAAFNTNLDYVNFNGYDDGMECINLRDYEWKHEWGFAFWFNRLYETNKDRNQGLFGDENDHNIGSFGVYIVREDGYASIGLTVTTDEYGQKPPERKEYYGLTTSTDEWHHISLTGNGQHIYFYLDGKRIYFDEDRQYDEVAKGNLVKNNNPVFIGGKVRGYENLYGYMKEVYMYQQFLTGEDVDEIYRASSIHTTKPTTSPTPGPTPAPSASPSADPTAQPTSPPSPAPTFTRTPAPTPLPAAPTAVPTLTPPTFAPTIRPTFAPSDAPTEQPSPIPTVHEPTGQPTSGPTSYFKKGPPTFAPSNAATAAPTATPTGAAGPIDSKNANGFNLQQAEDEIFGITSAVIFLLFLGVSYYVWKKHLEKQEEFTDKEIEEMSPYDKWMLHQEATKDGVNSPIHNYTEKAAEKMVSSADFKNIDHDADGDSDEDDRKAVPAIANYGNDAVEGGNNNNDHNDDIDIHDLFSSGASELSNSPFSGGHDIESMSSMNEFHQHSANDGINESSAASNYSTINNHQDDVLPKEKETATSRNVNPISSISSIDTNSQQGQGQGDGKESTIIISGVKPPTTQSIAPVRRQVNPPPAAGRGSGAAKRAARPSVYTPPANANANPLRKAPIKRVSTAFKPLIKTPNAAAALSGSDKNSEKTESQEFSLDNL